MRKNNTFEINVKNGLYIGDICYALDEKIYDEVWCDAGCKDGAYTDPKTGLEFAVVATAYGDGFFNDFPVDAGNIGIVDLGICTKRTAAELDGEYGRVLSDYVGTVEISYEDGIITVSTDDEYLIINTLSEDEDDDDWWQDDWDSSEEDDEDEED